ncbi:2TM domain-containing protein [Psychroserpens ponticola]|uniref:2TM domain-containing protein n=1 Tax=Psychroserpens ponticola TaxID=2932268 RepID=A0ABY7RVC6_9FLAO|nr:2TM domain-containing protein [Psychroserpens ponticola]WCO00722.1 2TM domain-containing protein [Psychroserpens ponticola]
MDNNHFNQKQRYQIAEKRVKRIKGFYTHALIFTLVNLVFVYINIQNLNDGESYFQWRNFITFSFWGVGLLSHAGSVFLPSLIFGKNWETKKIKELMDKDSNEIKRYE